jgi:hypothetical protein
MSADFYHVVVVQGCGGCTGARILGFKPLNPGHYADAAGGADSAVLMLNRCTTLVGVVWWGLGGGGCEGIDVLEPVHDAVDVDGAGARVVVLLLFCRCTKVLVLLLVHLCVGA